MRSNLFITNSKKLIKIWTIFAAIWVFWSLIQLTGGLSNGWMGLVKETSSTGEMFIAFITLGFFVSFSIGNLYKMYELWKEFKPFEKNYSDNPMVKHLRKLMIAIAVITPFTWVAGFIHVLNVLSVLALIGMMASYTHFFRKMISGDEVSNR